MMAVVLEQKSMKHETGVPAAKDWKAVTVPCWLLAASDACGIENKC